MSKDTERRHFWRAVFHSPVHLSTHGSEARGRLLDISLKGALVDVEPSWSGKAGDACRLKLTLSPEVFILMMTTVAHREGTTVGLRCDKIDLDSITHLRRLVELNAGDPKTLDRELGSLLAAD